MHHEGEAQRRNCHPTGKTLLSLGTHLYIHALSSGITFTLHVHSLQGKNLTRSCVVSCKCPPRSNPTSMTEDVHLAQLLADAVCRLTQVSLQTSAQAARRFFKLIGQPRATTIW